ncbi:hypothetical protein BGZ99_010124, partial [Dissophora globulifera]
MSIDGSPDTTTTVVLPAPTSGYRFPHPNKFADQCDGFSVLTWLKAFGGCGLQDDAPFDQFESKFKFAYVPSDIGNQVRAHLAAFHMSSTVDRYVAEARQLLTVLLADADENSACKEIESFVYISFIQGCPKALNELLRVLQVTSSLDVYGLFQAAEQYDQVYHFKPDYKSQ